MNPQSSRNENLLVGPSIHVTDDGVGNKHLPLSAGRILYTGPFPAGGTFRDIRAQ
jgi:hypothetical protein